MNPIAEIALILLFSLQLFAQSANGQRNSRPRQGVDTIDYSHTWVNKQYLAQLRSLKSHAKLFKKFHIAMLGLAPNETDLMITDFETGLGYRQIVVRHSLLLVPDETREPLDTFAVRWMKRNEILVGQDTLVLTDIEDMEDAVTALLYEGSYQAKGKKVTIARSGRITGLDDYDYIIPKNNGAILNDGVNVVEIKKPLQSAELFFAEFIKDTLRLYRLDCTATADGRYSFDCIKGKRGELTWELVRQ